MSNQAGLGIGDKVHNEEINEYPEWLREEYLRVCTWAREVAERYRGAVLIRIVDPESLVGIWRLIRHWIRRYPTFLVDGQKFVGWESEPELLAEVERRLQARGWPLPSEVETPPG